MLVEKCPNVSIEVDSGDPMALSFLGILVTMLRLNLGNREMWHAFTSSQLNDMATTCSSLRIETGYAVQVLGDKALPLPSVTFLSLITGNGLSNNDLKAFCGLTSQLSHLDIQVSSFDNSILNTFAAVVQRNPFLEHLRIMLMGVKPEKSERFAERLPYAISRNGRNNAEGIKWAEQKKVRLFFPSRSTTSSSSQGNY